MKFRFSVDPETHRMFYLDIHLPEGETDWNQDLETKLSIRFVRKALDEAMESE